MALRPVSGEILASAACLLALAAVAISPPPAFAVDVLTTERIWEPGSAACIADTPTMVAAGEPVIWHNADSALHTLVGDAAASDGYSFAVTIPAGGKASHTFSEPGDYSYYCAMRPHLGGTVLVREGTSSYYEYDPPLLGAVRKTTDTVWTDAVFGPGQGLFPSFVSLCAGNVCLPTAYVFGTDPSAILSISADGGYFPALGGAMGLDTYKSGSSKYAIVAGSGNDAVQIIDVSNPLMPASAGYVYASEIPGVADPYDVAVYEADGRSIALVTSQNQDSVQMLDVTWPSNIRDLGAVLDGEEFTALDGASHVRVVSIESDAYALVSSYEGIQIVNVTADMSPVSTVALNNTRGFDTVADASGHYAVVVAGRGLQIIDIADVLNPHIMSGTGAGGILAHMDAPHADAPDIPQLLPRNVAVYTMESGTYALVTWSADTAGHRDGLQIVNITDMSSPRHTAWVEDTSLNGSYDVAVATLKSNTYALVTAYRDGGLRVFDIADPESPRLTSSAQFPGATHISYMDGCAAVTSFDAEGVYMVCLDAYATMQLHLHPAGNG